MINTSALFLGAFVIAGWLSAGALLSQQAPIGYDDTPMQPDGKWKVHDSKRPRPPVVTPGPFVSLEPPADAIVLLGAGMFLAAACAGPAV